VRRPALFLLFCFLLGGACRVGEAATDALKTTAKDLAVPGKQRAALERMRGLADPATRRVLQALKEGALYLWQGNLLIFTAEGVFVDLDGKKLLDDAGAPLFPEHGMEQVPLEEAYIPMVQRALDVIELFAPDPAKRKSTALRLGNLQDASLTPILEQALKQETDAEVRGVLVQTVNKARLFDPHPQVRL
jgi:urea transport system permease protein